ncbi:DUF5047 domain-containing protein [Streptomyces sp. NPDC020412]|uniref:DUF5047 domain-containing protein n=1 Tax=Streptomyces sp. NPDC020412 TaxID=3365073 RepID=UPI0037B3A18C
MYPVSERFLQALSGSYSPITQATLFRADGIVEQLAIIGGTVTVDRSQQSRRTCSITFADLSLIPRTAAAALATFGARLRISRGVRLGEDRELVSVGVFRVDSISGDIDTGPVTFTGKSLESFIADDRFTAPYRASGTAVGAITALIQRSAPGSAIDSARAVDAPIGPRSYDVEGDPWAAVTEIGTTIGCEVYCDADGVFVVAPLPDIATTTPVWTIAAGHGGAYIQANRGMSTEGVRNGWLVRGENTESNVAPVSALVVDNDPGSPTYWSGPFGRRPGFYTSPTITTTAAATAAGTLKLRASVAPNATADISTLPNPALEPGDVIRVVYPDGTRELHQVHSFPIDLGVGAPMALQTISAKEGA